MSPGVKIYVKEPLEVETVFSPAKTNLVKAMSQWNKKKPPSWFLFDLYQWQFCWPGSSGGGEQQRGGEAQYTLEAQGLFRISPGQNVPHAEKGFTNKENIPICNRETPQK